MAADHSARGSMKTGVKPETVCELQDTNDHRQVERKWRLPISVGKLSALEGRLMNLHIIAAVDVSSCCAHAPAHVVSARRDFIWRRLKCHNSGVVCYSHADVHALNCIRASAVRIVYTTLQSYSTSGVLDYALNLSISLSAGKETKWDSPSNGE